MQAAKPLSILLLVLCILVIKVSPDSRIDEDATWFRDHFDRLSTNHRVANNGAKNVKGNADRLLEPKHFKLESSKQKFHSINALGRYSKWRDYQLLNRLQSKHHDTSEFQHARHSFAKVLGVNSQKQGKLKNGGMQIEEISRSGDNLLRRRLLSIVIRRSTRVEMNPRPPRHALNEGRRGYERMVSGHHIAKRNAKTSEPTQASKTTTTNPPVIILPPPPLPPQPSQTPATNPPVLTHVPSVTLSTNPPVLTQSPSKTPTTNPPVITPPPSKTPSKIPPVLTQPPPTLPTQPNIPPTTNPPVIILPPSKLQTTNPPTAQPPIIILPPPPIPSFTNPPVCSGQKSCSGRCTGGDKTEWRSDESLNCYCDAACYELFNDCCTDFTQYCGVQEPRQISITKFYWTCEPLGHFHSAQSCAIGDGLWMVSRCADDWPDDEFRSNCENPTKLLNRASDVARYIPAMYGDITFRNYFCAKCNRISGNLQFWPVDIKASISPPRHYNFTEKVNFLLLSGAEFPQDGPTWPKSPQTRRYCVRSAIVDTCPGNTTSDGCTNGPVALVSGVSSGKQFKNFDCALCDDAVGIYDCFPLVFRFNCRFTPQQRFLLRLEYSETEEDSIFTIQSESCGNNALIYDNLLQECVEDFPHPVGGEDKFHILAWLVPSQILEFTGNELNMIMKEYFGVEPSQIFNISIDSVHIYTFSSSPDVVRFYHVVSSTILLSPEQSFDILYKTDFPFPNLRKFIHFEKPLSVTLNNITYTIMKTTSRAIACVTRKVYSTRDYVVAKNERVTIISSSIDYKKSEYFGEINGYITLCEKYSPSNCKTTHQGLTKHDFIINTDLSLSRKDAAVLYKLGQYQVSNNSIALCNLAIPDPTCPSDKSCVGRCSNHTEWRTEAKLRCSCDPDCYQTFSDCCSDYTKYCGAQKAKDTPSRKYDYTCEEIGYYDSHRCQVGEGLWMVARCPHDWPYDTFRTKCEQAINKLTFSSPDPDRYLPVLGHDNTTFRNMYCAICNGVEKYESWPLHIETSAIPPEKYNVTEKIRFLLSIDATFPQRNGPWQPGVDQVRRYCVKRVIDSCPLAGETSRESCTNGTVAVVTFHYDNYKNKYCAACHSKPKEMLSCFPGDILRTCERFEPQSFSLVFDSSKTETIFETRVSIRDEECGESGMIFDDILQVCRVSWLSPPEQNGQERFYVFSWLRPPRDSQNTSFKSSEFQDSLATYLNISRLQLLDINTTNVILPQTTTLLFYLVSSIIVLTPRQSLDLLAATNSSRTKLRNFIYFSEQFTFEINDLLYNVAKTTSRPLACVGRTTYTPEQYILRGGERIDIPSANTSYEKFEYFRENFEQLGVKPGNITVCEKLSSVGCDGDAILYTPEEYLIMVNLSIYVNETSSLYHYGEYDILFNKSVTICQREHVRIIIEARLTIRDNEALGYLTFLFFLLSILFLIFLLVTYMIFPKLRTLPGKNLMNLGGSLLMFEIFWLVSSSSELRADKPSCMAIAILEHYFLMASFASMAVIAFHTCKVFARRLPAPRMSKGQERKLFCIYLAVVWLLPAIMVAICVLLDTQGVMKLGYGELDICWLTENNAYTFFVTVPIALTLLFNMIAFITTAVYLRKHGENEAAKHASGNRQSNLSIYVKLSTLMGFTWLFGLLALVVTATTVFWYFFVIFTSLQGVFVTVAFAFNAKTLNLYRQGYKKHNNSSSTPIAASKKLTTNIYQDTKL